VRLNSYTWINRLSKAMVLLPVVSSLPTDCIAIDSSFKDLR
jgi:hypothetical protein